MVSLSEHIHHLQSLGTYTFTLDELKNLDGYSQGKVSVALNRLKKKGKIANPYRGFYTIVPIEYESQKILPATWFIDDLMKYLDIQYYVGILSASQLHGAAHQKPMVFQVVASKKVHDIDYHRLAIRFFKKNKITPELYSQKQTTTGYLNVSTPEATALDLIRHPKAAGYQNNIATVLIELVEEIDKGRLKEVLPFFKVREIQRLGYFLDYIHESSFGSVLYDYLIDKRKVKIPLVVGQSTEGCLVNRKWNIIINEEVDPDL